MHNFSNPGISNIRRKNILHILRVREMQYAIKSYSHLREDYRIIWFVEHVISCGLKIWNLCHTQYIGVSPSYAFQTKNQLLSDHNFWLLITEANKKATTNITFEKVTLKTVWGNKIASPKENCSSHIDLELNIWHLRQSLIH